MDKEKYNELSINEQLEYFNEQLKQGGTIIAVSTKIGVNESTVRLRFKKIGYKIDRETNQFVKFDDIKYDKGMTTTVKPKKKKEKKTDDDSMTTVINPVENEQNSVDDKKYDVGMTSDVKSKNKESENKDKNRIEARTKSVETKRKSHNDDSMTTVIQKIGDKKYDKSMTDIVKASEDSAQDLVVNNALKGNIIELAENHSKIMEMLDWFNSEISITNVIEVIEHGIKLNLPKENSLDFRTTVRVNDAVWEQFKEFCKNHKEHTQKDLLSQALVMFMERYKNNN